MGKEYKRVNLDKDLSIYTPATDSFELKFIYKEIFSDRCYEKFGIKIDDNSTIIDVGANVGLFSISLARRFKNIRILAIEPVPPIYNCLKMNTKSFDTIQTFSMGLADFEKEMIIEFMPHAPGNSTLYSEEKRKEGDLASQSMTIKNAWRFNKLQALPIIILYPIRKKLLKYLFNLALSSSRKYLCKLTSLDIFIESQNISKIDLLKIDVEGAEKDVFEGLSDRNLEKIQQIVIEVSPARKPWIKELVERLRRHGFKRIHIESMVPGSDPCLDGFDCNLYALR